MRVWRVAITFLAALILPMAESAVAAAADDHVPEASESYERIIPNGFFRDLYSQALSSLHEYIELEGNLPGTGSSTPQAGEFRLKLFPQGKSRSREHLSAEGSYHLAPDSGQREFTLRFKSSNNPPSSLPNDDVI